MSTRQSVIGNAKQFVTDVRRVGSGFKRAFVTLILFALTGFSLFPIFLLINGSLKSSGQIFTEPIALPETLHFDNFVRAWHVGGFSNYFINSAIVVLTTLALLVLVSSMAAYALARFDFPAQNIILVFILAGFMIPPQVLLVPLFSLMNTLGLLDTWAALIFAYLGFSIPFSVFFLRQYFVNIPDSYAEAARIGGVSELTIFGRIYLPLAVPAISAVVVFQFIFLWNEFLYALVFITTDAKRTLPAGLMAFSGQYATDFTGLFAGIIIAVTPTVIFFLLFQKQFVRGFTMQSTDL